MISGVQCQMDERGYRPFAGVSDCCEVTGRV